ncbi:hypothetical protein KC640_00640 [Candidatus Dojkabacteria bacterium]|uniref:GH18 domain-containing protein n=1 Tax=Candidatus Dojkabacteria bacterium TaxID=2099670 RepID=A0A955I5F2_9BACT|nr:hypothetical protein [Candidatus Dojkabacteria bacterium]
MWRRVLLTILLTGLLFGLLYLRKAPGSYLAPSETPLIGIDFTLSTPSPINQQAPGGDKLVQTAWIPDWGMSAGLTSFAAKGANFDSISPVWYYLNDDGLISTKKRNVDETKSLCQKYGVKLVPSIANFDSEQFEKVLSDPDLLARHVQFLVDEVLSNDFDGLDLDYESVELKYQPAYLYLIREISDKLHAEGKVLTIAVISNWTNSDIFRGLRQTRQAQDLATIASLVDEVRIMTYDMTSYSSTFAGPVAPLDWLEANLRYLITLVDPQKIMLGLPLYGYDGWSNNPTIPKPYLGLYANPGAGAGQADAVTYQSLDLARANLVSDVIEEFSQEQLLTYDYEGKRYFVFYPSVASTALRIDLAKQYGVKGVAYWRMGGEDLNIYDLLDK